MKKEIRIAFVCEASEQMGCYSNVKPAGGGMPPVSSFVFGAGAILLAMISKLSDVLYSDYAGDVVVLPQMYLFDSGAMALVGRMDEGENYDTMRKRFDRNDNCRFCDFGDVLNDLEYRRDDSVECYRIMITAAQSERAFGAHTASLLRSFGAEERRIPELTSFILSGSLAVRNADVIAGLNISDSIPFTLTMESLSGDLVNYTLRPISEDDLRQRYLDFEAAVQSLTVESLRARCGVPFVLYSLIKEAARIYN